MIANARAIDQGASHVEAEVSGAPWTQTPFPYQARCLAALRVSYARLEPQDRADLEPLLNATGCAPLFS